VKASASVQPAYLIDASIYIFQAHFSPYIDYRDSHGEDLSALSGFIRFLLQFLRRENPAELAVAHDMSLFSGFRHGLCASYKSNRELPDANLAHQLKGCVQVCGLLGLPAFASRRFEADDIIGVISKRLRHAQPGKPINIISRDKDLAQLLVGKHDLLWDYQKNSKRGRTDIEDELGVSPEQIPDYLGLVGDAVDRISGVPGIGPVAARRLLQEWPTMEIIYENLTQVAELPLRGAAGLAQRLRTHRDKAELSKLLATIVVDVEDSAESFSLCDVGVLARQNLDLERLRSFLSEFAFTDADSAQLLNSAEALANRD